MLLKRHVFAHLHRHNRPSIFRRSIITGLFALCLFAATGAAAAGGAPPDEQAPQASAGLVGVTVVIENLAPANGTWLTPVWVGFHSGTFDAFDTGSAASTALERLAEDGNAGPLSALYSGEEAVIQADTGVPQLAPGETATRTFVLDSSDPANRYFSFATMVIPSNDAFIGNDDPLAHRVFDDSGNFLGGYITITGDQVLDAGTEVNDELPQNTAFFGQTTPNTGVDENGVVHAHPGYLSPGSGGILDDPDFANADFTQPGYQVARITLYRSDTVVSGGNVSGTWAVSGSPYILQGDVTVPGGATLTVDPGVVVYSDPDITINVAGNIEAIGTADQPILFTGAATFPSDMGWRGIQIQNSTQTSHFEYCTIEYGDRATLFYGSAGAIGAVDSDGLELRHCTLRYNRAYEDGATIYCVNTPLVAEDCDIFAGLINGSISARGGGIYAENTTVQITGSRIHDNQLTPSDYFGATNAQGGGIALESCSGLVAKNLIYGNYLSHSGTNAASEGGGVWVDYGTPVIRGNTIYGNEVHYNNHHGGGVYISANTVELTDNIVAGNVGAGVWFDPTNAIAISHNDFYGNSEGATGGAYVPGGLGNIVQTNHNSDPCDTYFNIFLDPLLVAPGADDFHLQSTSPCIDAGDPGSPDDPDGTIADIGARYFDHVPTGVTGGGNTPVATYLMGSWPSPMSSSTSILYRLPAASPVKLTVYDVLGRVVRTLVDKVQQPGVHRVRFEGRDDHGRTLPSGVYLYRLATRGHAESRKLTIVH